MMIALLFKDITSMVRRHVYMQVVKIFQQTQDVCGMMAHLLSGGTAGGIALKMVDLYVD